MERHIIFSINPLVDLEKTVKALGKTPGVVVEASLDHRLAPPSSIQAVIEFVADGKTAAEIKKHFDTWATLSTDSMDTGPGESRLAKFAGTRGYKDYRAARPDGNAGLPRYEFLSGKTADSATFDAAGAYFLRQPGIKVTTWMDQTGNAQSQLKGAFQVVADDGRTIARAAEALSGWQVQGAKIWPVSNKPAGLGG